MPREPIRAPLGVNVPGLTYGRFSADPTWPDLGDPRGGPLALRFPVPKEKGRGIIEFLNYSPKSQDALNWHFDVKEHTITGF
jgi:hypothetical protein